MLLMNYGHTQMSCFNTETEIDLEKDGIAILSSSLEKEWRKN